MVYIMYNKRLAPLFILVLVLFVGDSVFADTERIPNKCADREIKPLKRFRGSEVVSETIGCILKYQDDIKIFHEEIWAEREKRETFLERTG